MSGRPHDDERIDAGLRRLLSGVHPPESGDFSPPDEETVRAYVEGRADAAQIAEVEEAMLLSADFQETVALLRQVELDFAGGAVLGRLEDGAPLPRELREDVGGERGATPLTRLRDWFWRPQMGYGLAAAAILALAMLTPRMTDRTGTTAVGARLLVGLPSAGNLRGGDVEPETVTILPGIEAVDVVLAKELPASFLDRYRVRAELRHEPGGEVVASAEPLETSYPAGDGAVYLLWSVPVRALAAGEYSVRFVPSNSGGTPEGENRDLVARFRIVLMRQ